MIDADHPTVLVGGDNGAVPVELVLTALASCLTAGIGNIAAARGVKLTEVTEAGPARVEVGLEHHGILPVLVAAASGGERCWLGGAPLSPVHRSCRRIGRSPCSSWGFALSERLPG